MMKRDFLFKFLILKRYFDTGFGLSSYAKYFIGFYGIASLDVKQTMAIAIIWGLLCFPMGWAWIRYKMAHRENEISNTLNPFMGEVRRAIKSGKFK